MPSIVQSPFHIHKLTYKQPYKDKIHPIFKDKNTEV